MKKLTFERIQDSAVLADFYCGIDDMDEFLHGAFHDYISLGISEAYCVKDGDVVVAMYALDRFNVFISDQAAEGMQQGIKPVPQGYLDMEHPYWRVPFIDSIELTYLAVARERQHEHIGSFIIEKVIQDLLANEDIHAPLLTVRAYKSEVYTAVPFYEKCGFFPTEKSSPEKPTLCMYRLIV